MQQHADIKARERSRGNGYVATIVGADIGFAVGFLSALVFGAAQLPAILSFDPGALFALLSAIFALISGGYIGGLIGSLIVLSATNRRRVGRTVGFLALLYPLPLLLAGSDLFIGALMIPLLARWLALKDF